MKIATARVSAVCGIIDGNFSLFHMKQYLPERGLSNLPATIHLSPDQAWGNM